MSDEASPTDPKAKDGTSPAACATQPCPKGTKKVLTIVWDTADAWCSDTVHLQGTTENYADGEKLSLDNRDIDIGASVRTWEEEVRSNAFSHEWKIVDFLPRKDGEHYVKVTNLNGLTSGKVTPVPLKVHFIPTLPLTPYTSGRVHFNLDALDYLINITSTIQYVKGWAAEVVNLGNHVPAGTGGLLDGQLTWNGYRWMKRIAGARNYWDGSAWKPVPATLNLDLAINDSKAFSVGFYENGTKADGTKKFTCQYGGDWVESFTDWNISAADKQAKITAWKNNADTTWTDKFDLKRKECQSTDTKCCRYKTKATITFSLQTTFSAGMLIVADGNIRSNDSLWFLGEPRIAVAAHEFGHHLGNPDEYAGAAIDTSLNDDGAVNGIDPNSIMGQNLTTVKKRHYRTICTHFAAMVKTESGKTYTYEAVPKA